MQILGVADTDKRVFNVLNRALEDEFRLQVFPGNFEHDEMLQFVDMIIYDLKGGKASFAELKRLRQVEPTIPILLLVQAKSSSILEEAIGLGATDFIAKPFNKVELLLRVRRCLREYQSRKSSRNQAPSGDRSKRVFVSFKSEIQKAGKAIGVPLGSLHSATGQLDASAFANYLSVPLAKLATALGVNYTTLHKTPDSAAVQPALAMAKRVLVILSDMLGKKETVLAWLNSPHPDLGDRTPMQVILEGHISAVLAVLENALVGVPG